MLALRSTTPTLAYSPLQGACKVAAEGQEAVLLNNGEVLMVGGLSGSSSSGRAVSMAELYDPATGVFTPVRGDGHDSVLQPSAMPLKGGKVLVARGYNGSVLNNVASWTSSAPGLPASGTTRATSLSL